MLTFIFYEKVQSQWNKIKIFRCNEIKQDCNIHFICGDASAIDWSDADIAFAFLTCFDDNLTEKITRTAEKMKSGSFIISVTKS